MNDYTTLPPGITQIIGKDDMRTERDKTGITPAKCFRDTGIVWTNNKVWPNLSDDVKCFILGHEGGHIVKNTDNEFEADASAFDWCMKNGVGLHKMVTALTRVLSYPEDRPRQKNEQEARTKAMLQRCLEYDWRVNGNEKAKNQLMQNKMTALEYESHLIGTKDSVIIPTRPPISPAIPINIKPSVLPINIKPSILPIDPVIVPEGPNIPGRPINPAIIPVAPVTPVTPVNPVISPVIPINTYSPISSGYYENLLMQQRPTRQGNSSGKRSTSVQSQTAVDDQAKKKILGLDPTLFYIIMAALLLLVIGGLFMMLRK